MSLIKRESSNHPRTLESFWGDSFFNDLFSPAGRFFSGLDLSVPRVNVVEEEKCFRVTADLPGVPKENVEVSLSDGILTISAHSESETKEDKEGQVIRHERHEGKYLRRLALGPNVAAKDVQAKLKDGVLTLNIPKLEATAPSAVKIPVQ
jgi:HSP20 family protein